MESVSRQTVAAAKLPALNPNEFELWKMRIEQYFLMTDYALWEVILNGDSPPLTRSVEGVETPYPPTTGTIFILELAPYFLGGLLLGIGDKKKIRDFRELVVEGFIYTNFSPLINMKPSVKSPGYEIKIASCVIVEANKIIRGCRLELEGHIFIINLIPFGYGSVDVIVGMDWLSKLRVKIVCYEKIIQILLSNEDILEVHGERPKGLKQLKSMKVNEPKLEDILVVCEFPSVFLEDLSGLPPSRKGKFRIDLIPGAMLVAKSPYRLAPMEMQELFNQLIEL
uniref:Putative reverse transcriptase domain-containing protein n=1 Tax=Tanacetum cinerariifolium TaxID=118510 RepID=A0A6L2JZW1_TANCI|nr:putative reverse transcriptase domain-containing protein [Tanacetum cinerariifolium]